MPKNGSSGSEPWAISNRISLHISFHFHGKYFEISCAINRYKNVKEEDGKILAYGYGIFPNRKVEFRNTYEFTTDGKLHDKWFRFEDGEWKAGHSRIFKAK